MATAANAPPAWIDITMDFGHPAGTWPGDAPFQIEWTAHLGEEGALGVNLSRFSSSPHNGTHSDAPYHVAESGATSEKLPLDPFLGPCRVIDASREEGKRLAVGWATQAKGASRVLFKTRRGPAGPAFPTEYKGLDRALVRRLVSDGVKLVGTDAPSVDSGGLEAHRTLFEGGAVILENLDLSEARPGDYELVALPLKVAGLCAAPVRALLRPLPP